MTGKITASSGKIGGWTIGTDKLYAGSGTSYVALNTNASYPAIWAGNGTHSSAPFRVYQDGSVYITSLYALKEDGTQEKVDLRSSYWKMDSAYSHAVKTLSVENGTLTIALYNGTTVNFNKADLSGVSVGTNGMGSVYVKDADGNRISNLQAVYIPGTGGISNPSYAATEKKIKFYVAVNLGSSKIFSMVQREVDATAAYDAGYADGQASMGVKPDGNTVSVVVSDTKSATASVGSSHRISYDSSVSLTPGQTFSGAPGTYYKNPQIVADHWIDWTEHNQKETNI